MSTELEVLEPTAIESLTRAEVDMQIATAKKYPRSLGKVKAQMLDFATLDEETAASCLYAKPQGGKTIQGPSVRLAEIAVSCFGNIRAASRVIANDGKTITCQGVCHDLENNTSISVEVHRSIRDKNGKPYPDHMVVTTSNAGNAIAFRNAVYKVVPKALIQPVYEAAKNLAIGNAESLNDRRAKAFDYFQKMGVAEEAILRRLEREDVDDVTLKDLVTLKGLGTAIVDDEITLDDAFPPEKKKVDVMGAVKRKRAAKKVAAAKPEPEPEPEPEPLSLHNELTIDERMMALSRSSGMTVDQLVTEAAEEGLVPNSLYSNLTDEQKEVILA